MKKEIKSTTPKVNKNSKAIKKWWKKYIVNSHNTKMFLNVNDKCNYLQHENKIIIIYNSSNNNNKKIAYHHKELIIIFYISNIYFKYI